MNMTSGTPNEMLARFGLTIFAALLTFFSGLILYNVTSVRDDISAIKENNTRLAFQVERLEGRVDDIRNGARPFDLDTIRRMDDHERRLQRLEEKQ